MTNVPPKSGYTSPTVGASPKLVFPIYVIGQMIHLLISPPNFGPISTCSELINVEWSLAPAPGKLQGSLQRIHFLLQTLLRI